MKRIYAFTMDSDDYPSDKFRYNLRLIAFLLHDYIYNYDGEGFTALIINDKIKNNAIYEDYGENKYRFEYDEYSEKYINYEPFLIGDRSFALTIDDEVMSEDIIRELMEQVMLLARVDYNYTIRTISYVSKDREDESQRKKAVRQLRDTLEDSIGQKKALVRKRLMVNPLFKGRVGLF